MGSYLKMCPYSSSFVSLQFPTLYLFSLLLAEVKLESSCVETSDSIKTVQYSVISRSSAHILRYVKSYPDLRSKSAVTKVNEVLPSMIADILWCQGPFVNGQQHFYIIK